MSRSAVVGYLDQNVISDVSRSLIAEISSVFRPLKELESQLAEVSLHLTDDPEGTWLRRYSRLEEEYSHRGGYDYPIWIDTILSRFGFQKDEYDRVISSFSGGERTRIAFAKLLLQKPELLILDEPTNHMDIDIIEWLEDYLKKYPGAGLVITHDKYFINRMAAKIYESIRRRFLSIGATMMPMKPKKSGRFELLVQSL